jgi:ATP-dependent RNA helicase DDX51/DBP6
MASQLYARYVPPKKKANVSASQATVPAVEIAAPPKPTQSSTRQDASSTYARYTPPSKLKLEHSTQPLKPIAGSESPPQPVPTRKREESDDFMIEPSSKKPKKVKKDKKDKTDKKDKKNKKSHSSNSSIQVQNPELEDKTEATLSDSARVKWKMPKSKKKTQDTLVNSEPEDEEPSDGEDSRHKRLMEKREKSLKKAEKRAMKEANRAATEISAEEDRPLEPAEELHDLVPLPQPEPVPEPPARSTLSSLPPWIASPIRVSPTSTAAFSEIGVNEGVAKHLKSKGFKKAFAVQAAVLPLLLPGPSQRSGDVLVSAATGSGKTLAYVLPMIEDISKNTVTRLRGLIVMPTRELVTQAREVCEVCASAFVVGARKRVRIGTAVGNETFKMEQAALMEQELRYDPAAYKEQLRRLNSKWESSDLETDGEDEILCQEEIAFLLPDHVIDPTSKVDILICTPGRLVEHLKSTPGFSLEYIKWLVVDEADKLLDQSFQQWLNVVMTNIGMGQDSHRMSRERIRKIVLSATMTRDIGELNNLKLHRPRFVVLEGSTQREDEQDGDEAPQAHILPSLLVESAIKVEDESIKPLYLLELLEREDLLPPIDGPHSSSGSEDESSDENSSSDGSSPVASSGLATLTSQIEPKNSRGVLIFTKSNETAIRLGRLLSLLSPSSDSIISTLTSTTRSSARRATLSAFKSGKLSILVASDLVSRGLDLPNLAHVINYDIPTSVANYVHRVGRTARAGKMGNAWTLFTDSEGRWFWNEIGRSDSIQRQGGKKVARVNIKTEKFGEGDRMRYEVALEDLAKEASAGKARKTAKR